MRQRAPSPTHNPGHQVPSIGPLDRRRDRRGASSPGCGWVPEVGEFADDQEPVSFTRAEHCVARSSASVRVDFDAELAHRPSDGSRADTEFAGDRLG